MLSPALDVIPCIPNTLLPPLTPSSLARSRKSTSSPNASCRAPLIPRSPRGIISTPRAVARLSTAISSATSPYFSPSNPFSIRPRINGISASGAKYALIDTLPLSPVGATPSIHLDISRVLRQRGKGGPLSPGGAECNAGGSSQTSSIAPNKRAGPGKKIAGVAGWIMLGVIVSLGILTLRSKMDGGMGGVGAVQWVEPEAMIGNLPIPIQARGSADIWADRIPAGEYLAAVASGKAMLSSADIWAGV